MSGSRPVSRVLSRAIIHLGRTSPYASSDLPGSLCEPQVRGRSPARFPIWSCSRWGLPCHRVLPPARCALTAPFHPYLPVMRPTSAVYFLLHCPWARAPQVLPGTLLCGARTFLCKLRSDCLADSRCNYTRAVSMQRAVNVCVQRQRASRFQQRVINCDARSPLASLALQNCTAAPRVSVQLCEHRLCKWPCGRRVLSRQHVLIDDHVCRQRLRAAVARAELA